MRVALDAMGGDHAPGPNIEGAAAALEANPDLEIRLVGDESLLREQLSLHGLSSDRLTVVPSQGVVGMDEKPTQALRAKPDSSIAVCWKLMAGREVEGVVSAGNTGAVVAAGLRTRLFLKGVRRPGIAVTLPTAGGQAVMMDVGANPGARPEHLVQYAVMGTIYAKRVLGIESPRVGLMNIGTEDGKGNELYREAHQLLSKARLECQYIGNVEGRGLYRGEADVVICEGFVGNVVLKVSEGMAEFMMRSVMHTMHHALDAEREQGSQALQKLARSYEYSESGGAPLLGIDGVSIICHGASDGRSIANALKVVAKIEHQNINEQIMREIAGLGDSADS